MGKVINVQGRILEAIKPKWAEFLRKGNTIIGQEGVTFFKNSFRNQGFTRNTLVPWRRTMSGKGNTHGKRSSGILIRSGKLMRSIFVSARSLTKITITAPMPYAQAHNEGFKGTVQVKAHSRRSYAKKKVEAVGKKRGHTVKEVKTTGKVRAHSRAMNIPRRQYMGESPALDKILEKELTKLANTINL